jgi:hypothetical protein
MKRIVIILALSVPLLLSAQYRHKETFKYRPAPKAGEWIAICGTGLLALSATVLHTECKPLVGKTVGYIGGAMCFAGVVIDFGSIGKSKYKLKVRSWK